MKKKCDQELKVQRTRGGVSAAAQLYSHEKLTVPLVLILTTLPYFRYIRNKNALKHCHCVQLQNKTEILWSVKSNSTSRDGLFLELDPVFNTDVRAFLRIVFFENIFHKVQLGFTGCNMKFVSELN